MDAKVVVAVRVRPLRPDNPSERYESSCIFQCDTASIPQQSSDDNSANASLMIVNPTTKEQNEYSFDRVFDEADNQQTVYSELVEDSLVEALDRGGDLTIVAYGQTGSGKTFTMLGERSTSSVHKMSIKRREGGDSSNSAAAVVSPTDPESSPSFAAAASGGTAIPLSSDSGLFLRVMNALLSYKSMRSSSANVLVFVSAIEIYNETFIDLLAKGTSSSLNKSGSSFLSRVNAAQSPNAPPTGGGFSSPVTGFHQQQSSPALEAKEMGENLILTNVQRILIDSPESILKCFDISHRNRSVASTGMNEASSRSHAIFQIDIVTQPFKEGNRGIGGPDLEAVLEYQQWCLRCGDMAAGSVPPLSQQSATNVGATSSAAARASLQSWIARNKSNDFETYPIDSSRIILVDLAGSERVKRSGVVGKELQEAVHVNSSLSALGLVVRSLCFRQQQASKHIPFRDSKMTRFLRPSFLSPSAKIIFVTNLSPTSQSYMETLNSLRFAIGLKDLKHIPGGSGVSLTMGALLADERQQRLRQQMDEMSADIRIGKVADPTSTSADVGSRLPRMRRSMIDAARQRGASDSDVLTSLMVRSSAIREALLKAREEMTRWDAQQSSEAAALDECTRREVYKIHNTSHNMHLAETRVAEEHLSEAVAQQEATLTFTRSTCRASIDQIAAKAESLGASAAAVSAELAELSKRKRDAVYRVIGQRTQDEELSEELSMMQQNSNMDAAHLMSDRSVLLQMEAMTETVERSASSAIAFLEEKIAANALRIEVLKLRGALRDEKEMLKLVQHESSHAFVTRMADTPVSALFDPQVVRTFPGRRRVLDERLELSSGVFGISPLAYYFSPEQFALVPRFVPWGTLSERRAMKALRSGGGNKASREVSPHPEYPVELYENVEVSTSSSSDEEKDVITAGTALREESQRRARDGIDYRDVVLVGQREERMHSSIPRPSNASRRTDPVSTASVCMLRVLSLHGHFMRIMSRANKRKHRAADTVPPPASILVEAEVEALFTILSAVEVDGRVAEAVVSRAESAVEFDDAPETSRKSTRLDNLLTSVSGFLLQHRPAATAEGSPLTEDRPSGEVLPAVVSPRTVNFLESLAAAVQARSTANTFLPPVVVSLQALSLLWTYDTFFSIPNDNVEVMLLVRSSILALHRRLLEGIATEEEKALLEGCMWAARSSDPTMRGWKSIVQCPTSIRTQRHVPSSLEGTSLGPPLPFLWHATPRDLSLLRSFAARCVLDSGLSSGGTGRRDKMPTVGRLMECFILIATH